MGEERFPADNDADTVSVGFVFDRLGSKSYGALIILFALIACLPMPGPNALLAIPLYVLSFQLILGKRRIALPEWVRRRKARRDKVQAYYLKVRPRLLWFERKMARRWYSMVPVRKMRVVGFICFFFTIIISLPIPLPGANTVPALCLVMVGMGLMMRDGFAIFMGSLIGFLFSVALCIAVFYTMKILVI